MRTIQEPSGLLRGALASLVDEAAKESDLELGHIRDWEPLVKELAAAQ